MCDECGAIICAMFDRIIEIALLEQALAAAELEHRRRIHPTSIRGATGPADSAKLSDLVAQAMDIGLTPQEMEAEIVRRSGMERPTQDWIREKAIPNGLVRKIILTNVEAILREQGARPQRSAQELVPA